MWFMVGVAAVLMVLVGVSWQVVVFCAAALTVLRLAPVLLSLLGSKFPVRERLLIGAEYAALFGFTDFFSREGGAQLQYIIAAAACFVIFDLKRIRLIGALVLLALVLVDGLLVQHRV